MNSKNYIGKYDGYDLWYEKGYYSNNRVALQIMCKDKDDYVEPYAVATINLPGADLPSDYPINFEEAGKTYGFVNGDLDEEFKSFLRENHIISDAIRTVQYNYGTYELVEILV